VSWARLVGKTLLVVVPLGLLFGAGVGIGLLAGGRQP
jgi:hypothetical protein